MKFARCAFLSLAALLLAGGVATADERPATIPMTLTQSEYGGGRIYVPARFANVMGSMRLDTGASTSRIALAPWNKDFPSVAPSSSLGASGSTESCEDVETGLVALKASQGRDVARGKYVVTRCAASGGDDLLGLDFFNGARVTLDFTHGALVFDEPASSHPKPLRLLGPDHRLVGVDVKIGGVAVVGLLDTGAEICAVDRPFWAKHKNLFTLVKRANKASEAGGKGFSSQIYKIKQLDLGEGRLLRDVSALVYDFGSLRNALGRSAPVVLGFNLVSQFDWSLDFSVPDAPTWDARGR